MSVDERIESLLRAAFGNGPVAWELTTGEVKEMEYSGSLVCEVILLEKPQACDELPVRLLLKLTKKQEGLLNPQATESARIRALRRDSSYRNECIFLQTHGEALGQLGCRIPRLLHSRCDGDSFELLLESMSASQGWKQDTLVSKGPRLTAVLEWLAKFHAAFLPASVGGRGLPLVTPGAFEYGTSWALDRRDPQELKDLPEIFDVISVSFKDHDDFFATLASRRLGQRLQDVAPYVARVVRPAHAGGQAEFVTMAHGDFKSANFFFNDTSEEQQVAVIDWQWTGAGIGAADLIYLCVCSLPDEVVEDHEACVLRPYHAALSAQLCQNGGSKDAYSYEQLVKDFKFATVDLVRYAISARYPGENRDWGFTPQRYEEAAKENNLNAAEYRRSIRRLLWLLRWTASCLEEVELSKAGHEAAPTSWGGCVVV